MSEIISTTYKGVVISYEEYSNEWRNKETERNYDSLTKAKEAIDRAGKISKKMEPIPCILREAFGGGDAEFKKATITSFADEKNVWLSLINKKGKSERKKQSCERYGKPDLYVDTPENWALIEKLKSLWKNEREINGEIEEAYGNMEAVNVELEYRRLNEKMEVIKKEDKAV